MADTNDTNTTADREVIVERERSSSAGPIIAVAVIILLILLAWWAFGNMGGTDTTAPGTDVNVQTPAPTTTE